MISPPGWRTNSTTCPAGATQWKAVLEAFWKDFKPKSDEVMERKPSEVTEALDEFLSDYLFPPTRRRHRPARLPASARRGPRLCRCAAARSARSSPARTIPSASSPASSPSRAAVADGARGRRTGQASRNRRADHPQGRALRPLHPDGRAARKPSAPRSPRTFGELDLDWAVKLLEPAAHDRRRIPRRGEPITASIGRYGPYLAHDGKYAKLRSHRRSVRNRHEPRGRQAGRSGATAAGRGARAAAEPLKTLRPASRPAAAR